MANTEASQNGIKNSWTLIEFARIHGRPKLTTPMVNSVTGEEFKSVNFQKKNSEGKIIHSVMVNFSSNLGELTKEEIAARKDSLQVIELNVDAETLKRRQEKLAKLKETDPNATVQMESYKLCEIGEDAWEDIDLGI